ncbi:putative membrane protein DUF2339 [Flavobacterium sp. 1]|uniref:DUF2339 domain-containing protein n=1 Tax=Flavobacterium sp. 1 TaxID=2035200 RepID=UPI000C24E36D|nr:DUF2339 domain-containing protein [Flavobacterium sp. 1]PJJ09365.1 putative membrane protein DUF2339 [Flavobacterium sp. 1]
MAFFIFVLFICIVVLFNNFFNLKKSNDYLESLLQSYQEDNGRLRKEISEIKKAIEGKTITVENGPSIIEETKPQEIESIEDNIIESIKENTNFPPIIETIVSKEENIDSNEAISTNKIEEEIFTYESKTSPRLENKTPIEEKIYEESAFSKFLKNAEKQFADNWTGILGTAIMVLGIGYLSIYTALTVAPLFRILIIWLYASLLAGSFYILKKKEKWVKTGLWLRSAAASLFLFGTFGASQIPPLTFITNTAAGYSLIAIGIAVNLYIGYIIKKQTFLSLHVILSILILCVIPEKLLITFILASITCTIGIILSYKEKWEYHLLIVITAFIIFDIWFNAQGTKLTASENIIAILGIITVAGSCMFMQYRGVYENTHFDKPAFITHLTNWVLFATGLLLHSMGSKFKTFVLFFGAIICLVIALRARKKKVYWLYHLDGMVSFILLALSIIMLNDLKVGIDIIACILYVLILVCLFVVYKEKETLLHKIFLTINHLFGASLIIFCVLLINNTLDAAKITNAFTAIILLSIIALSIPIISSIKKEFTEVDTFYGEKNLSLNGILAIVFSVFVILKSNAVLADNSFYYIVIGIAVIWTFLKKKFKIVTFDIGRFVFYALALFIGLFIIHSQEKSYSDWIFTLCFLSIVSFNWFVKYFYKNEFIIRFIGIVSVNALLLILSCKYLQSHPVAQIFSLFGIAVLNHEFLWLNFKKNNLTPDNQRVLYLFYYLFTIVGSLLLLYRSGNLTNTENGLTCLGISIIEIYVLFAKKIRNKSEETINEWTNYNLLNSELLLFTITLFGFSCIQMEYVSIYFIGFAILLFLAFQKFEEFKRYSNYSFLLLTGSIILTLFVAVDNIDLKEKTIIYSVQTASVLLSIGYSYLQFKSKNDDEKRFITILPYIQNLWIITLLLIQVEINYLPLLFMILSLINFYLIYSKKIQIKFHFVLLIAMLAILVSASYSINKLNNFNLIDWILQLSSIALGLALTLLLNKKEAITTMKTNYQITLNIWLSIIMFTQLEHKWLPVYWVVAAILNLYFYHKKISQEKNISIVYYLLANLHLGFLSFNFYQSKFLAVYLLIFVLLGVYIYLASKWMETFKLKNSLLIYPATLSIGCFLYLSFDKGILTFFWILEALGLLILGIMLKEKYFRYVSLSLVGICVIRLMFFDLSNSNFLIRALVLLGVGIVLLVMNSLFKKYKDRFD